MKTYKEFIQNLDENKFTRYMAKKVAKQVIGASSKLFSGKKSQGAKFLKRTPEGKNIRQQVANTLRGDKGIGTTHSQTKNTPAARRMSEFELSKLDKQMNQSAGRFISGAKSGENYKAYQSPNKSFRQDYRAPLKQLPGGKDMLKQYDDLAKKSYEGIKPSDAANQLKRNTLKKSMTKKVDTSGLDPVQVNQPTLARHQRMRGMSKKKIRDVNKRVDSPFGNMFAKIFGTPVKKRVGPTQHHKMRAQDTAIMKRSVANSDAGLMDILGGNPEGMRNTLGKFTYASIKKGKVPQPPGAKKTKTPKWMKSLNRHDDDFEYGKVDFKK
tara:strand:- start:45 stop:1019 length:975 start_codon:yes stop_codon:yes gene_type:complete